jgi:hypothetical protein
MGPINGFKITTVILNPFSGQSEALSFSHLSFFTFPSCGIGADFNFNKILNDIKFFTLINT